MLRTAIAISLMLAVVPAQASEIYKCVDPAGKVEYRNSNCPSGTTSAAVDFPVATGKTIEIRRSGERDVRRDADVKDLPERLRARPSEPVNALPPAPAGKAKQD